MTDAKQSWTARFVSYHDGWTIYGCDEHGEYQVAESIGICADSDEEERDAKRTARLIASAPDLLEALTALYASYKALADSGDAGNWRLEDTNEGQQTLAAIARATGEAS